MLERILALLREIFSAPAYVAPANAIEVIRSSGLEDPSKGYEATGRPILLRVPRDRRERFMKNPVPTCALMLLALASCAQATSPLEERKGKIAAMASSATAAAIERRARSVARLKAEGVPVVGHLPVIEDARAVKRRTQDEIAWRAMALLVVAVKGEGLEQPIVEELVRDYGLDEHFTPEEAAFIRHPSPSEHDRIQFAWRYEAAWTLLWALGYVEELGKPTEICDVPRAVGFLHARTSGQFISESKLRPIEDIVDEADLIYRYHWAVVDARINSEPTPASLEPGVTMERHHALNWLIGYMDQEWDDISTDT